MDLTASEILAARDPQVVFGSDTNAGFRQLAKKWHPDINKDPLAGQVMAKLQELRDLTSGKPCHTLTIPSGTAEWSFKQVRIVSENTPGVIPAAVKLMSELRGSSESLLKRVPAVLSSTEGSYTIEKKPEDVPFAHVFHKYPSGLPSVHVAWIASRLYETVAHLHSWAGVVQLGLLPESLMLSIESHGVTAMDWRFSLKQGERVRVIPGALRHLIPTDKKATPTTDLKAINELMIQLLGDPSGIGNKLLLKKDIDRRFLDWFRAEPMADPVEYYKAYRKRLEDVFGPPAYHRLTW